MPEITLNSHAKINLTLDVLFKRPDNYHEVRMIMQTIGLHDTVRIIADGSKPGLLLECSLPYLPLDGRNIAYKAAELFFEKTGIKNPGIKIELTKRIPVAAGLAGGSGNAAAVLKGLNLLFGEKLEAEELNKTALLLGADVPYCLMGGTVLAEGIGERLKALPAMPLAHVVLIKPPFSISTASVYGALDIRKISMHPDTEGTVGAIAKGDLNGLSRRLYNVLYDTVREKYRRVHELRSGLIETGALGAVMSGSGPSVYGLFDSLDLAKRAYDSLKENVSDVFLTENFGKGLSVVTKS